MGKAEMNNEKQKMPTGSFENICTCGGYAHRLNGRNPARPHMDWCPQREEYNKWYDEFYGRGSN